MNSIISQNDSIFYDHEEYQKRSKITSLRNNFLNNIGKNDILKQKFYNKKIGKENSIKNIKYNDMFKEICVINNIGNKKVIKIKSRFPSLNNDWKQIKNPLLNYNSLINFKKMNHLKIFNSKYLYLEYKKEMDNEAIYIEIDPYKIISSLTDFPLIKNIFKNLTKKINKRDINKLRDKNNYDSKINIDDIFMEKRRNNNQSTNQINDNIYNTIYYKNNLNNDTNSFLSVIQCKDDYSVRDLFLLDIINKVIKNSIYSHDSRKCIVDEKFMLKEYKKQIKKLKIFFDDKINKNNSGDLIDIKKEGNKGGNSKKNIDSKRAVFANGILSEFIDNKLIFKNNKSEKFFLNNNKKQKNKFLFGKIYEKNDGYLSNNKKETKNIFNESNANLYNFDIGHKINIVNFNEFLYKRYGKGLDVKDGDTNKEENIFEKILDSNMKKIKNKNIIIDEKTKIVNNKSNLFINHNNKYISRNVCYRKFNRKKLSVRKQLFNTNKCKIKNEKEINFSNNEMVLVTGSNESYSLMNESNCFKALSQREKYNNKREEIDIKKLVIKKDFGITKEGFDKRIDKIKRMHYNKSNLNKKKIKLYNYSFLNTIYGKINTKRNMKINDIDYKEEIRQKGLQLLSNIFNQNSKLKLNKNISAEDIFMSKKENKNNYKTSDKGTNTEYIKFN